MFQIKDLKDMTIEEKIGQLIMIGFLGTKMDDDFKYMIEHYKAGNVILFSRNYSDSKQIKKLLKETYETIEDVTGSFPLVSIDQEGGMVTRLFKDVTFPASPMTTSATSFKKAPYITGSIIARDMLKLGINMNLAPCLEINKNLSSPLANVRSYGGNKELVLKNTQAFVDGMSKVGVLSTLKHFPGAGSSTKDSHLELPIITLSKKEMVNDAMYPFINLKGADAIMSSHCLFKAFDEVPSTLSHNLLTKFLREERGFDGIIISDGMEMKAIADNYGIGQGSVMALKAGCDILLLCHEKSQQIEAFEAVIKAYKDGIITEDEINEKVERINRAKNKVLKGLIKYDFVNKPYKVVKKEHKVMTKIVDSSYTLLKGEAPRVSEDTLIISPKAIVSSIVEDEFNQRDLAKALRNAFPHNIVYEFNDSLTLENLNKNIDNYKEILIFTYDACSDQKQQLITNELLKGQKEVFVVSLKGPTDKQYLNNLKNYACLYEYTPNSIQTIVKQLKGKLKMKGKLPK